MSLLKEYIVQITCVLMSLCGELQCWNLFESQRVKRQKEMEVVKVIHQVLPLIQMKEKFF